MRHTTKNSVVRSDNQAVFTSLYQSEQRGLLAYATSLLCGDVSAAEDAVDDAFADVWRKGTEFSEITNPAGWMRRVVRNKAIDALRKGGGREETQSDIFFATYHDSAPDPEQACALHGEQGWLRDALTVLNADQREVIVLCYFEGLSLTEIADTAQCPVNTVKTRLHYARRKLHAFLEQDCVAADIAHLTQQSVGDAMQYA